MGRRGRALLAALLLAALGTRAMEQSPVVTDTDIERVRRAQPSVSGADIDEARRRYGSVVLPSLPSVSSTPNVDALPQPVLRTPIDLEALARGYAAQAEGPSAAQGLTKGPALLVFVSLSMPRPALQRLVDQAARAKATVVLRGFAGGSLRDTAAQLQALIGTRDVAVQIDPQSFDRFAVAQVPTFVLVRDGTRPESCASGTCAPPEVFLRVAGDVSLDYALAHMRKVSPAFGREVAGFLAALRPPPR